MTDTVFVWNLDDMTDLEGRRIAELRAIGYTTPEEAWTQIFNELLPPDKATPRYRTPITGLTKALPRLEHGTVSITFLNESRIPEWSPTDDR